MPRLIGVYDNDQDVEQTMEALQTIGVDTDEIEFITRGRFAVGRNFRAGGGDTILAGTQGQAAGIVPDETEGAEPDAHLSDRNIAEYLQDLDLPDDEAAYYARRIYKGGSLLLIDVDEDQADQVAAVMKRHNVQVPGEAEG